MSSNTGFNPPAIPPIAPIPDIDRVIVNAPSGFGGRINLVQHVDQTGTVTFTTLDNQPVNLDPGLQLPFIEDGYAPFPVYSRTYRLGTNPAIHVDGNILDINTFLDDAQTALGIQQCIVESFSITVEKGNPTAESGNDSVELIRNGVSRWLREGEVVAQGSSDSDTNAVYGLANKFIIVEKQAEVLVEIAARTV